MSRSQNSVVRGLGRLKSWEGFLLLVLIVIIIINSIQTPAYLSIGNQMNLFTLSIEKIIVALMMTFIIINAEIDLSVASMMGLASHASEVEGESARSPFHGFEFVGLIKQDERLGNIPVMIVSYKDREEDRQRGLDVGADYYLTKGSFHDETLIEAVVDLIGTAE